MEETSKTWPVLMEEVAKWGIDPPLRKRDREGKGEKVHETSQPGVKMVNH
jgi:hypothetical protein